MRYEKWGVIRWSLVLMVSAVFGVVGCGGDDEEPQFDCDDHSQCLADEACLGEVCVDAPQEGDACPEEHEGEEYEELVCDDGTWQELTVDPPTIVSVTAEPPTVEPGQTAEVVVEVDSEFEDDDLVYAWSASDGWDLVDDDVAEVEVVAIDEPGVTGTIEVEVTDPEGESDTGDVEIATHEIDGPQIESIEAAPEVAIPGTVQVVIVEASHPEGHELDYQWQIPEGWEAVDDAEGDVVDLVASEDHGDSGEVEVTVIDEFGQDISTTVTVHTEELFCGGEGTESEPWDICSAKFVNRVGVYGEYLGDYFELTENVDMGELDEQFYIIGDSNDPFAGVFDGGGHVIENLEVDYEHDEAGLFGRIGDDGEVYDLELTGANISGEDRVGVLAGRHQGTTENIRVAGNVSGTAQVGGLVGENRGTIFQTSADVDVDGDEQAGGLVGRNTEEIGESTAKGEIEAQEVAGGLVGRSLGQVTNSYATGDVDGDDRIGGLVGENSSTGVVNNAYATGRVFSASTGMGGGLVASNEGEVEDSFFDWETTGMESDEASEMSTEAFEKKRNFPDTWEFYPDGDSIWVMREDSEGDIRPSLGWEQPCTSDDATCDNGVCDEVVDYCVRCNAHAEGDFGSGEGTSGDPWGICTEEQLRNVADENYMEDDFVLFDDIEITSVWNYFDVIGFASDGDFEGGFDGQGYWIEGFEVDGNNEPVGLFGTIGEDGEVRGLTLVDADVSGDGHVGALAGKNKGTVEECHVVSAEVEGDHVAGGLVGLNEGMIDGSSSSGLVNVDTEGDESVGGGLVGQNEDGVISHSSSSAEVTTDGSTTAAGGLVGNSTNATIEDSFATGDVVGEGDDIARAGGLIGLVVDESVVARSYATGNVSAQAHKEFDDPEPDELWVQSLAGGLVGGVFKELDIMVEEPVVEDCYSLGSVVSTAISNLAPDDDDEGERVEAYAGGSIGQVQLATVERVYSTGSSFREVNHPLLSLGETADAVIGEGEEGTFSGIGETIFNSLYWDEQASGVGQTTTDAEGLMTANFEHESSFDDDWDFDDVWMISIAPDGFLRPVFQWQE